MKGTKVLLVGGLVALVAMMVPFVPQSAYADELAYIERLVPAESQEVQTGGGEDAWVLMEPSEFTHDAGSIERLLPADAREVETGGGESSPMFLVPMAPAEFGNDAGYIERLLPAD